MKKFLFLFLFSGLLFADSMENASFLLNEQLDYCKDPTVKTTVKILKRVGSLILVDYDSEGTAPAPTLAERESGFQAFTRNCLNPINYNSVPGKGDLRDSAEMFASLGQCESVQIGVIPLIDLKGVKAAVSDFSGPAGSIPASAFEVRWVRYLAGGGNVKQTYLMAPEIMETFTSVDLKSGITYQFWVTVKVPETAKGGIYNGSVMIAAPNSRPSEIKVKLEVIPVTLEKGVGLFGFWYGNEDPSIMRREINDLKDYGLTTGTGIHMPTVYKDGNITIDPDGVYLKFAKAVLESGWKLMEVNISSFGGISAVQKLGLFSPGFNKLAKDWVEKVKKFYDDNKLGPCVINVYDEPRDKAMCRPGINISYEDTIKYLEIIKSVPGVKTVVTCAGPSKLDAEMIPLLDRDQPHLTKGFKDHIALAKSLGKELITYNNGYSSLAWGFCPWKAGASGNLQWVLPAYSKDRNIYSPIKKNAEYPGEPNTSAAYATEKGMTPGVKLVYIREGIDDYRYITALEKKIAELAGNTAAARDVSAAKAVVEEVRNKIPDYPATGLQTGYEAGETAVVKNPADLLKMLRYKIAKQLEALSKY